VRHMALDVGDERIGVALSDQSGFLARPLEIIARRPGPSSFVRIAEIIAQYGVELIVVGLPLMPDGSEGEQVRSTRAYVAGLTQHADVPIVYWDERLTTFRAREIIAEQESVRGRGGRRKTGTRSGKRRRRDDAIAAAVILQEYLDEHSGGPTP
jgi:putative Holliday junction resolvase